LSGRFVAMGPFDWLFWCSTATN